MESSKIKNFIICILVVVNLFLAGLLSVDWVQTNRTRIQAEETAYAILENYGIAMDGVTLPDNSALNGHSLCRDFQREQELVSAVLGEVSVEDQGGNIMYYYGEKGQANFRGTGDFEILFHSNAVPVEQDTVETARNILKKMGMEAQFDAAGSEMTGNTYSTVVMTALYDDTAVFNCQIRFIFAADFLLMVEGTRILDVQEEDPTVTVMDGPTLLTRFLGILDRSGYVCSQVQNIRGVLQYAPDPSGGRLMPVWEIKTDTNTFYVNASTGEEQPVT